MKMEIGEDILILRADINRAIRDFEDKFPDIRVENIQITRQEMPDGRKVFQGASFRLELNA